MRLNVNRKACAVGKSAHLPVFPMLNASHCLSYHRACFWGFSEKEHQNFFFCAMSWTRWMAGRCKDKSRWGNRPRRNLAALYASCEIFKTRATTRFSFSVIVPPFFCSRLSPVIIVSDVITSATYLPKLMHTSKESPSIKGAAFIILLK